MKMGAETAATDTAEAEKIVTLTVETTEAGDSDKEWNNTTRMMVYICDPTFCFVHYLQIREDDRTC